jgi:hypothetical protein
VFKLDLFVAENNYGLSVSPSFSTGIYAANSFSRIRRFCSKSGTRTSLIGCNRRSEVIDRIWECRDNYVSIICKLYQFLFVLVSFCLYNSINV